MIFSLYSVRGLFFGHTQHKNSPFYHPIRDRFSFFCCLIFFFFFFARPSTTSLSVTCHAFLLWLRILCESVFELFAFRCYFVLSVCTVAFCVLLLPFLVRAYLRLSVRKPQKHVWFVHTFFRYIYSYLAFVNVFSFYCFCKNTAIDIS